MPSLGKPSAIMQLVPVLLITALTAQLGQAVESARVADSNSPKNGRPLKNDSSTGTYAWASESQASGDATKAIDDSDGAEVSKASKTKAPSTDGENVQLSEASPDEPGALDSSDDGPIEPEGGEDVHPNDDSEVTLKSDEAPGEHGKEEFFGHGFDATNGDMMKAINSSNVFGGRFYSVLSKIYPNFVFSPVSISILMALILRGSDGNTLKEIYEVMGYKESGFSNLREVQSGFHGLSHEFHTDNDTISDDGYKSEIATSMWINDGKKINSMFLEDAANSFHTKLRGINFKMGSDRAQTIINKWVNERTEAKLMSCSVRKVSFGEDTEIVFLNTIYFSAHWFNEFKFCVETTGNFMSLGNMKIKAKFLQAKTSLPFYESKRLKASIIEIPFKPMATRKPSLIVILPDADSSIKDVEEEMQSIGDIFKELKQMKRTELDVMIPKRVTQDSLRLDRLLQLMGIRTVFNPDTAELTFISAYERLVVDRIYHEAVFEFKESGAAIASGPELGQIQNEPSPKNSSEPSKEFYANKPFVFLIVEKSLSSVMFMGRVVSV